MADLDSPPQQFECKPSVNRSSQINFGIVPFTSPQRPPWEAVASMRVSKHRSWEMIFTGNACKPNPRWIQSEQELNDLFDWLELEDEFCIHVRICSYNAVVSYTTMIQIATWQGGDYLINAMPLRDAIERRCKSVLENPKVLKIMCSSHQQVQALQQDYGIYIYGIADVIELVKLYNPAVTNYYTLCKESTSAQCAKLIVPSSELLIKKSSHDDFIHYVAHEVHFVLRKFNRMRDEAEEEELVQCFDKSQKLAERFIQNPNPEKTRVSPLVATTQLVKNFRMHRKVWTNYLHEEDFNDKNKSKIVAVVEFREMLSKAKNLSAKVIMADYKLLSLCLSEDTSRPSISKSVEKLHHFDGPQQHNLVDLLCSTNPEAVMAELRAHECENCHTAGHGSIDLCIFSKPTGIKTFHEHIHLPENRELKKVYDHQLQISLDRQQKREQEVEQAVQQLDEFVW